MQQVQYSQTHPLNDWKFGKRLFCVYLIRALLNNVIKITSQNGPLICSFQMAEYSGALEKTVLDRFLELPATDLCQATYIWIDGTGENMRCKTKTLEGEPKSIKGMYTVTLTD